jgi:nucleolar protein 56
MTEETDAGRDGWFSGLDSGDVEAARAAIADGRADAPADWPALAVETGYADSREESYPRLHEATVAAARSGVRDRERAEDQQVIHAVRAMDDCTRTANELTERVAEWGSGLLEASGGGIEYAREVAAVDPSGPAEERVVALATRATALADETEALRSFVERTAHDVAPNLAALAGPVLAARLIALAGGLESLARKPSGTVQVLGAEEALFAHLRGDAPSPKHGVIYTHEYVRGTDPAHRGSAARALAGKLAIAARIDHYSGDRRPHLERELDERIARIRARETEGAA